MKRVDRIGTARRWHWRTWNLLVQIRDATDGTDPRQVSGEMTARALAVLWSPQLRALTTRRWVKCVAYGEYEDEHGEIREGPYFAITPRGRSALELAISEGIQVR